MSGSMCTLPRRVEPAGVESGLADAPDLGSRGHVLGTSVEQAYEREGSLGVAEMREIEAGSTRVPGAVGPSKLDLEWRGIPAALDHDARVQHGAAGAGFEGLFDDEKQRARHAAKDSTSRGCAKSRKLR